jgi:hypothetical protein
MVNSSVLNMTFDVTNIANASVVVTPVDFLYNIDSALNHYLIVSILFLLGFGLFFAMKKVIDSEVEALGYSGIVIVFFGLLLFLARTTEGEPLLSFIKLTPFIIVTAITVYINFSNRRF